MPHGGWRRRCRRSPARTRRAATRAGSRESSCSSSARSTIRVSTADGSSGRSSRAMWRSPRVRRNRSFRQKIAGCCAQPGDFRTAIALEIESGRASGRVVAAMIFGFDDQRPPLRRDFGSKARAGDAAAHDDYVKIAHFRRWLRIGKPRRLGVATMFNVGFTDLLLHSARRDPDCRGGDRRAHLHHLQPPQPGGCHWERRSIGCPRHCSRGPAWRSSLLPAESCSCCSPAPSTPA